VYLYRLLFVLAAIGSSPALADKLFAVTPSGSSEMMFASDRQLTASTLSSKCIDARWILVSSTQTEVICEAPLNMGQSILGQALLGNTYSTPPRRFFRFNIVESGNASRVQASGWIELQMAFGQIRRNDLNGPEFQNSISIFLVNAGGQYPIGTTFPNHVFLGFKPLGVGAGKNFGLQILELNPGSPADRAGLAVGDIVISIAGTKLKDFDDYLDATAKAAAKPTYPVDYIRDGRKATTKLSRAFRPAITQQALPVTEPTGSAPEQANQAVSVANELEKLAKLRDQGIITEEEFQQQKRKILSR
jgi:membrane-associated protease RseP (regulator of RpoE activity)